MRDMPLPRDSHGTDVPPGGRIPPDARGLRWLRRRLASGVMVVTTTVDGLYRGATVTAYAPVSTDPPLLLVSLELDSQMDGWLEQTGFFAVSVLPWEQQFYADQFAGFTPLASGTFRDIEHVVADSGAPVLAASICWADCLVRSTMITGDHRCFIGEVIGMGAGTGPDDSPLIYYMNRYRRPSLDGRGGL